MSRTKGALAIDSAIQGAILIATDVYDKPYTEVAKTLGKDPSTIRKLRKRVHDEVDKENILFLEVVNKKRPRSERSLKLNVRQRRRFVRHAIKNKANRRKS